MANAAASVSQLRVEGAAIAFTVAVTGPAEATFDTLMLAYDSTGDERNRTDCGRMTGGQTWDASLDLPVHSLGDGDYSVWVFVMPTDTGGAPPTPVAQAGVSFMIAQGHVYPSHERPVALTEINAPQLTGVRLEGTWVVFAMTNDESFDIEVLHELRLEPPDGGDARVFEGKEVLRGRGTQEGHYLLPEDLADGRWRFAVTVRVANTFDLSATSYHALDVNGRVLTLIS